MWLQMLFHCVHSKQVQIQRGTRCICFLQTRSQDSLDHVAARQQLSCVADQDERANFKSKVAALQRLLLFSRSGFSFWPTAWSRSLESKRLRVLTSEKEPWVLISKVQRWLRSTFACQKTKSMIISIDSDEGVGVITVHNNGPAGQREQGSILGTLLLVFGLLLANKAAVIKKPTLNPNTFELSSCAPPYIRLALVPRLFVFFWFGLNHCRSNGIHK